MPGAWLVIVIPCHRVLVVYYSLLIERDGPPGLPCDGLKAVNTAGMLSSSSGPRSLSVNRGCLRLPLSWPPIFENYDQKTELLPAPDLIALLLSSVTSLLRVRCSGL